LLLGKNLNISNRENKVLNIAGFLKGVIILLSARDILIHNDTFENRQQTQGGVFLSHSHKSSLNDKETEHMNLKQEQLCINETRTLFVQKVKKTTLEENCLLIQLNDVPIL
jgi:hypothetical protein